MDILGIGTDIVECLRIGRMIEQHGELFLTRIFTEREVRYCQERKRAVEHFAGRWAAKEAVLKALGVGWRRGWLLPTWRSATRRAAGRRSTCAGRPRTRPRRGASATCSCRSPIVGPTPRPTRWRFARHERRRLIAAD